MFMDDRTVAQIAPSGNFGNTFSINCDNPLLSAAAACAIRCCDSRANLLRRQNRWSAIRSADDGRRSGAAGCLHRSGRPALPYNRGFAQILRRNVEGGGRQRRPAAHRLPHRRRHARRPRATSGRTTSIYQYGRTNFAETYLNDFSVTRLGPRARRHRQSGHAGRRSGLPLGARRHRSELRSLGHLRAGSGRRQAALAYLQTPGFQRGITRRRWPALRSPAISANGASRSRGRAAASASRSASSIARKRSSFQTDIAFQTGDLAGQGAPTLPVAGAFDVREAFAEVRIPIVEDELHPRTLARGRLSLFGLWRAATGASAPTPTRSPASSRRSATSASAAATTARSARRTSRSCSLRSGRARRHDRSVRRASPSPPRDRGLPRPGPASAGQFVASANPAAQYNGLIGGNPNLDAGNRRHLHGRRRHPAALHSAASR